MTNRRVVALQGQMQVALAGITDV
eukprot:COSAG02_NODE_15945_length_1126_cov_167.848101_1_plen_23_part_10